MFFLVVGGGVRSWSWYLVFHMCVGFGVFGVLSYAVLDRFGLVLFAVISLYIGVWFKVVQIITSFLLSGLVLMFVLCFLMFVWFFFGWFVFFGCVFLLVVC